MTLLSLNCTSYTSFQNFVLILLWFLKPCLSNQVHFHPNICYTSGTDIMLIDISYSVCVVECKHRISCVSINYSRMLRLCKLHFGNIQQKTCTFPGIAFSRKLDWTYVSFIFYIIISSQLILNYLLFKWPLT